MMATLSRFGGHPAKERCGFSLIELMVSIFIGMLVWMVALVARIMETAITTYPSA